MTCTNVKRMNGKVKHPAKPRNGRIAIGVLLAVLLVCVAIGVALHLRNVEIEQQTQVELRDDFVAELERNDGTYDARSIVLYNTSRAKAEELAEKFGASLRMTKDGKFATLTLPEGTTILDVCRDEENLAYIEQLSADYQVSISELIEGEDDEESGDERLPMRPTSTVSDTDYEMQTYLDYMNMQNVWEHYSGYGVTIAVIDTGIDTDHPEFAGRISEYSYNATEDKIVKDYVLENGEYDWSLVEDEQGHGTAVTGVIAASMNSGNVVGIAPEVTIITIKAECNEDGVFKRTSDLVFGLYYAIERDVSVVNMSFGTNRNEFADATQLAYDSDVICVAAAGNLSTAALTYPAADPLVIGVGALADGSWELAEYSNFGENVDVVAPGTTYTSLMDGKYGNMDGTSLACPAVTGLIALYMQNNPYVTFDRVTEELYASSYDLGDLGRDWYYGFGAVDANAFLIEERGTVTYDMLTDEVDDMKGTFIKGHALQELPEPDRLYAVFDGWYYDEHCTQRVEYYTDAFYGDLTLYASWVNEDDGIPFTYVILEDGTVEIRSYTGHRRFITVPEKIEGRVVSSIGDFAFAGETNLREIGLPSGLRHIGLNAFAGCYNLVSMYIPENVTEIEVGAFANCVRLSTVAFTGQSKLLTIGNFAFEGCGKLRTIELPATLQSVNGTAFKGTSALTSIRVQSGNQYFKSEDGVLFDISGETLVAYPAAHGTTYEIPESVKTVGIYAFYGSKVLFMDFGSTVESIESSAFESSSVLAAHLPDSVRVLGEKAFAKSAIKELTLGNGLTVIPMEAFAECSSLRSVHIPEGIVEIRAAAFFACGHLKTLTFAENSRLLVIADLAFACCAITELHVPASVIMIGSAGEDTHEPYYYSDCNVVGAFDLAPLRSVTFAKGSQLSVIGDRAFAFTKLESLELPEGLIHLGAGAFWTTPLKTITLPASLTVLEEAVFGFLPKFGYSQLSSITVAKGNSVYHDVDGVVYNLENTEIHAFPAGRDGEYSALDTTRKIMPYSFAGTQRLEKVTLPEGLAEIGNYGFCYSGCYTYDLPSTLLYIKNGGFYSNFRLNSIALPEGLEQIAEYAFFDCGVLPTIHIPDSVLQIGRYAFAMDWSLASVTFSENAKLPRISFGAFAYCGLHSFRVPANVSTMAQKAFEGCPYLTEITFAGNSKLESISAYMFNGCSNLQTITFEAGSALTSVQAHGLEGMDKLTTINWGDAKVTNIDNFAFRFCEGLTYLELPETVTNVGRYAFYGCKSLSELTLPANLEHIGSFAFLGTADLNLYMRADTMPAYLDEDWDHGIRGYYVGVTSVETQGDYKYATLSSGDVSIIEYLGSDTELDLSVLDFGTPITTIGGSAFEDKGITKVILPETLTSIQAEAFAYNPLCEITIPASVTFIGREAFTYTDIASLTFSEGSQITNIEQYAFEKTEKLTEVTLPASLTTMGRGVFQESGLTSVTFEEGIALERIPENAFAKTKLQSITLPDSVNYVDHNAFREISTLQSVTFGGAENISLQSNSFYHTGLVSLHIPANVTYIGEYSFVALTSLTEITVDENNPWYKSEDGLLLSKDGRKLIVVPAGRTGSLTVPASVEMLGFGAFEETKLSEVRFDPNANILTLGYRAFFKANNITSIDIPKSVISIDYYAFAYCENLQTVNFAQDNQLKGIYEGAFLGDINLEHITIPESIVEISDFAFYGCSKIDRIPTGESSVLKGIYSYAFAYTGIEGEFTTPETLIDIGDYAFLGTKITKLTVPDTNQWDLIIGIGAFEDCYMLEEATLPFIGASLDDMDYSWFGYIFGAGDYEANATYVPASLKTVTITEGQTLVGKGGFAYLTNVETLNLPHSICTLYNDAFRDTTVPYELTNTIMTWYIDGPYIFPWVMQGHFGPGLTGHLELAGSCVLSNNSWTDGVTRLGWFAFRDCVNMTSVTIPESVTEVGNSAFENCSSLTSIRIPNGVTHIENYTFLDCSSLSEIVLPDNISSIGTHVFCGCSSLTNIDSILEGMTYIPAAMFYGCTGLTTVTIPDRITYIEEMAFQSCTGLTSVVIPNAMIEIGNQAFADCTSLLYIENHSSLRLDIGSENHGWLAYYAVAVRDKNGVLDMSDKWGLDWGMTDDGFIYYGNFLQNDYVLWGYTGDEEILTLPSNINGHTYAISDFYSVATDIIIPEGPTTLARNAFSRCNNLRNIDISSSICRIEAGGLSRQLGNNSTLTNIKVSSENPNYHVSGNCLVETQSKTLVWGNAQSIIPNDGSVEHIGDAAFKNCTNLTSITIPNSVISIGSGAFEGCTDLSEVTIGNGVTYIDYHAFQGCTSLTTVTIPDSVTYMEGYIFLDCSNLKVVTLPDSVTHMGAGVFWDCHQLKSVTLPSNITSIEDFVFSGCENLQNVTIPNKVTTIGWEAFSNCSGLRSIVIPDGVTSIGDGAFLGCDNLSEILIPESVIDIGTNAFSEQTKVNYAGEQPFVIIDGIMYNRELTKIIKVVDSNIEVAHIPNGVTGIDSFIFADCFNLREVTIPNTVTFLGADSFRNCISLTEIVVPDSVETIGTYCFSGCSNLTGVTMGTGLSFIAVNAFLDCDSLVRISVADGNPIYHSVDNCVIETATKTLKLGCATSVIPSDGSVIIITRYAFAGSAISNLVIPDSVVKIEEYALGWCHNLVNITIGSGVTEIESRAFYAVSPFCIMNRSDLPITIGSNDYGEIALNAKILIDKQGESTYASDEKYLFTEDEFYYQIIDDVYILRGYIGPQDTIMLPATIEGHSYQISYFSTTAEHVVLPEGLTMIHDYAFYGCKQLQSVAIPQGVTSIGEYAFAGCTSLPDIAIPETVTDIGSYAFLDCSSLNRMIIPSGVSSLGNHVFWYSGITEVIIDKENLRYEVMDGVIYDKYEGTIVEALMRISGTITIPDYVIRIDREAFYLCMGMSNVIIPSSVTSIEESAFAYCTGLTNIMISNGVKLIGDRAFYGCTGLTDINIPSSVVYIGKDAFAETGYYNLEDLKDGHLILDGWLLKVDPDEKYIDMSDIQGAAKDAYSDCHLLKNVIWNSSVEGATNIETIFVKDIENNLPFNHPAYPETWLPVTVKNIVITSDVDLTELRHNPEFFQYVSGVTIYVEGNEKDLRWDDNFPGWNNGNRVIYGDDWTWVTFYDEQGNIISMEPRRNEQIIRKPVVRDKQDLANTYVLEGWDIDGDGVVDSVPAATVIDLVAHPVYRAIPKAYTVVFKDSETGEIYKQEILHYGDAITLPETPTRENSFLVGWIGYSEGMTVTGNVEFLTNWHTHDMGDWYQTVAPGCETEGENKRDCSGCDYSETETVAANGHASADVVVENCVEPTCTEVGGYDKVVYCTVCDAELSREQVEIPANGHTPAEAVVENRVEPTCTAVGGYDNVVYCTVCNAELSREPIEIAALGHDMGDWYQTVAPGCETEGENKRDCSRCDYSETETVAANGHVPAEAVVENRVEPTCTEVGGYDNVVYCTVCDAELSREQVVLEATGHSHDAVVIAPTCTEQGYTTHTCHCGDTFVDSYVDALGHTEAIDAALAPTCTETGLTEGKHCPVCNEVLLAQEAVAALGHTYESVVTDPTCTEQGYTTHTCHCGDAYVDSEVAALGHTSSDWIVDAEAQIGVEGSKHMECTACGETLETETIEALTEAPTTEVPTIEPEPVDSCNGTISAYVVLIAMLGCFAVAWRPRKNN